MTMFEELYALATGATLAMLISVDEKTGKMTISVLPKPKKDMGEPVLTKDLSLTATPADFDADFVKALTGYRETRQSLIEQAEATQEVLEAAKTASAKKAGEAVAKATKAAVPAPTAISAPQPSASADPEEHDDDEAAGAAPQPPAATTTAASGESFDLFG